MKFVSALVAFCVGSTMAAASGRWSVERATRWQEKIGWKAGSNFIPSTADNELEMWQAATYDPVTIDRELQFAQDIGFSIVRVFLHNLLWSQDQKGFLSRIDDFLRMADSHQIRVMFVLFDSYWLAYPKLGAQPEPIPGVHNSQWVQAPGADYIYGNNGEDFATLQDYVKGVVSYYRDDSRVLAWDIWNEPNNSEYPDSTIGPLLAQVVDWVHAIAPSQPITTPIWQDMNNTKYTAFQRQQLDASDVLSFHVYEDASITSNSIQNLKNYAPGRPLICTEYMARPRNSTFEPHLSIMKSEGVYAMNWGFVSGESGH